MLRIGVIGRGYMGRQHAGAYAAVPDARVVGVAGRDGGEALIADPGVDAVLVATPSATHRAVVLRALEAGKHVLCETPLAETAADARAMEEAARAHGRHLQVALLSRFAHPGPRLRRAVAAGEVGRLRALTLRRLAPGTSGLHHGDALLEILLFDLDAVLAAGLAPVPTACAVVRGPTGRIDHATALLEAGGAMVTVEASYLVGRGHRFRVEHEAYGDAGSLSAAFEVERGGPPRAGCVVRRAGEAPVVETDACPPPLVALDAHFVDVLRGRADPALLHAREAVRGLDLLERLRALAEAFSSGA